MKNIILDHLSGLSISDVLLASKKKATIRLSSSVEFKGIIDKGFEFLKDNLHEEGFIYGVTTGYGDDCTRSVPKDFVYSLPKNLIRFHGCGLGEFLTPSQSRAVLAIRLSSLCRGYSGVSFELLKRFETLIEHDILPVIPSEGSVGASGDLTPMSYVAAVISGERKVWYKGEIRPTAEVFEECGLSPYNLLPKEALAIMNGTSVMTALACEAYSRAEYLVYLSSRLTSMTCIALQGNPIHFNEVLFSAKPHVGQVNVASLIRSDLVNVPDNFPTHRLQDRYSTRCAPHVIGILDDFLPMFKKVIEIEINSANDNPLIDIFSDDPEARILSGGHFYGGHIAFVADSMKILIANIADLLDRQVATLVDAKMNHGLPPSLSGIEDGRTVINHGLKAVQIATSAWTAEALKGTIAASIFSRSTESHNQDKVSMGTIAARDSLRVLQLTEQVCAAHMVATLQAIRIREKQGNINKSNYSSDMLKYIEQVNDVIPYINEDLPLDAVLLRLVKMIQNKDVELYKDAK